jgi:23S rRNA pseudouridine2605 synthase
MEIRLQKYLAECGVASRRASEKLIVSGCVCVNGRIVNELGTKIEPGKDIVTVNGERISPEERKVYIMLNKPKGYVSTAKEQFDRPAVLDLLPDIKERLVPVGRLDFDTSGLLLMTNDGDFVYRFTHPKHGIDKVYIAKVMGRVQNDTVLKLKEGVIIDEDNYKTVPAKASLIKSNENASIVQIAIREGKNRQVRKMLDAVGHKVISLKRIAVGELSLGDLEQGKYRHLTEKEIEYLKKLK